ncbi:MAG TPA: 30S ribosomal protein S5 [Phycisphaerales bacterium]|nr:30S ribosomal protein S5 [Phycisphaerales bacterium]
MAVEVMEQSGRLESTNLGVLRTSATVKGGRRFQFGAIVVVGDRRGKVGFGYAKSPEVPGAAEKAERYAKRKLLELPLTGTTIPHEVEGRYSASKVRLVPAAPGTGVVAGSTVRAILEIAGITDCLTKCFGSTNKRNVVKAVFDALEQLRAAESVRTGRGQDLGATQIEQRIERGKRFMPVAASRGEGKAKGPVNTLGEERRRGRGGPGGGGGGRGRRGPDGGSPAGDGGAPAGNTGAAPAAQ